MYPLWMLKYLPNMPACHVGIAHDARGPCNTVSVGDASGLLALEEAARTILSGKTDAMIVGGAHSRVHAWIVLRASVDQQTPYHGPAELASKPFDRRRDGLVNGEGAAALMLETRQHAEARGAKILARLLGCGSAYEPYPQSGRRTGSAVARSIQKALDVAGLKPEDVGHVNAHAASTTVGDAVEAQGIRSALGDTPVVAYKSYFGNLGTGSGIVELVASILSLHHGVLPPTLNYEEPDPECPVNVVHGEAQQDLPPVFVKLSQSFTGQAAAAVLAAP
jgi:3-oxoacyl-[acyl-carrier-protein] synthase II